ncbi:MAG TPA: hypothetical protein VJN96_04210 [Vicinamibacterales bacterium]|nr:hypothetical protein [Vicinamibacterales bacterium]
MLLEIHHIKGQGIYCRPTDKNDKRDVFVHARDLRGGTVVESLDPGDVLDAGSVADNPRGPRAVDVYFHSRPEHPWVQLTVIHVGAGFAVGRTDDNEEIFLGAKAFDDCTRGRISQVFADLYVGQVLTCRVNRSAPGRRPIGMNIRPVGTEAQTASFSTSL